MTDPGSHDSGRWGRPGRTRTFRRRLRPTSSIRSRRPEIRSRSSSGGRNGVKEIFRCGVATSAGHS